MSVENGNPHSHHVEIRRRWAVNDTGSYKIGYGHIDKSIFSKLPFVQWRLRLAIKKAIVRHDKDARTLKLIDKSTRARTQRVLQTLPSPRQGEWLSEYLDEEATEPLLGLSNG